MKKIWNELYDAAKVVQNEREVSDKIYAGGAPCGACREFMAQLMPNDYQNIEIMLDYDNEKIVTLGELTPEWWLC